MNYNMVFYYNCSLHRAYKRTHNREVGNEGCVKSLRGKTEGARSFGRPGRGPRNWGGGIILTYMREMRNLRTY